MMMKRWVGLPVEQLGGGIYEMTKKPMRRLRARAYTSRAQQGP